MTTAVVRPVGSVDDLFRLDPMDRFRALIAGGNFPAWLRAEPLTFDRDDPIFGYGCGIEGCGEHSTQAGLWCTQHARDRLCAQQRGIGEAGWKGAAVPFPTRPIDVGGSRGSACRFCPERDAVGDGLCLRHRAMWTRARKVAGDGFDETRWRPGNTTCRAPGRAWYRSARATRSSRRRCVPGTGWRGDTPAAPAGSTWRGGCRR